MSRARVIERIKRMRHKIPGTVDVTLTPVTEGNTLGTPVTVKLAEKRPMEHSEQQALGIDIDTKARVWFLWKDELNGLQPERGWLITDPDGGKWQIGSTSWELQDNRIRLPCIKMLA